MIGHLQTNKAKDAVHLFSLIHSVDSLRLCEKLSERAKKNNRVLDILLEVNLAEKEARYGFKWESLPRSHRTCQG